MQGPCPRELPVSSNTQPSDPLLSYTLPATPHASGEAWLFHVHVQLPMDASVSLYSSLPISMRLISLVPAQRRVWQQKRHK